VVEGSSSGTSVLDTSYWRLTAPGLAAYLLLAGALPLLLPRVRVAARVWSLREAAFRIGPRLAAATVLIAALPFAVVAIASPMSLPRVARSPNGTEAPIATDLRLAAQPSDKRLTLSWRKPRTGSTRTSFSIYRSRRGDGCTLPTAGS